MIPTSRERVAASTSPEVNDRIQDELEESVRRYARRPTQIDRRLEELEAEWDIERAIEANASVLALAGVTLGATVDKRWLALPIAVSAFLLQHSIQGWCPPVPILRRLGFRTAYEIEQERQALKALRGDFDGASIDGAGRSPSGAPVARAAAAIAAARG